MFDFRELVVKKQSANPVKQNTDPHIAVSPSIMEAEAGRALRVRGQTDLHSEFQTS